MNSSETKRHQPLKCVRDIRDFPPASYRLDTDGRKWKQLCAERRALAMQLATHADGDGTSITAGVARWADALGWSRRTAFYRLDDLRRLNILSTKEGLTGYHGTARRALNVEALRMPEEVQDSTLGVQDSPEKKCKIRKEGVQDSREELQDTRQEVQDSTCTQPSLLTVQQTGHPTVLPDGWLESLPPDVGRPNAPQIETVKALSKAHGWKLVRAAIKDAARREDLEGMKFPWAKIAPALPRYIKEIGEGHTWRYENDPAYRAAFDADQLRQQEDIRAYYRGGLTEEEWLAKIADDTKVDEDEIAFYLAQPGTQAA